MQGGLLRRSGRQTGSPRIPSCSLCFMFMFQAMYTAFFFALLVRTRLHLLGTGRSKREQNVERKVGNVPGNLKDGGFEAPREPSSQREHLFSRAFIYRGAIAGGFFFFSALLHSVGGPFALETTRMGERERKKRDEKLNK